MTNGSYFSILDQETLGKVLNLPKDYAKHVDSIKKDTPDSLKDIAHYALAWGIGDDGYRYDFIMRSPEIMRENLKWIVRDREDELDEWLGGPEAAADTSTKAYIAFSNMRIASDEVD